MVSAALLFAWWPAHDVFLARWQEPQYSHGWIVPALAAGVLWLRRAAFPKSGVKPAWSGVFILGASLALQHLGRRWGLDPVETFSVVPALAGLALAVGGWPVLRWSAPAWLLTLFMLPWPFALESAVSMSLQRFAAESSAFVLQLLGYMAVSQGTMLRIDGVLLGVEEACSGLRMLTVLMALGGTISAVSSRPGLERAVILVSMAPLAVAVNVARIVGTAIVFRATNDPGVLVWAHDLAGWVMPLMAVGLLHLELKGIDLVRREWAGSFGGETSAALDEQRTPLPEGPDANGCATPDHRSFDNARWFVPAGVACIGLAVVGLAQQLLLPSRVDEQACRDAGTQLRELPTSLGEWNSTEDALDDASFRTSGATAAIVRHYHHPVSGSISMILLCGPPAPIAAHPPTVCYQGRGYEVEGETNRLSVPRDRNADLVDQFQLALFRERGKAREAVLTAWGWSQSGDWSSPELPRLEFAGSPVLYKLYLSRERTGDTLESDLAVLQGFAELMTHELRRTVFAVPSSRRP